MEDKQPKELHMAEADQFCDAAKKVPGVWKLVPVEATDDMLRAIRRQRSGARVGKGDRADWAAWLAAVPQPVGEVPMPEENIMQISALQNAEVRWIDRKACLTYGDGRYQQGYAAGVAAGGEVPMPELETRDNDLPALPDLPDLVEMDDARWGYRADDMRTYGEQCRAAGYAAGVAAERVFQEKEYSPETQMLLQEQDIETALRRAFHLGQIYWQQADSEYTSQHRKSEETRQKFEHLVTDTLTLHRTSFILQGEV